MKATQRRPPKLEVALAMDVQFVASFSPIVRDHAASTAFYRDGLELVFEGDEGDYVFTHRLPGVKHFGLWPLHKAARSYFETDEWPPDVPVPQASLSSRWVTSRQRRRSSRIVVTA